MIVPAMRLLAPLLLLLAPGLGLAQATPAQPATTSLPQATVDKMAEGDRLYLAGDYRSALFAYQDATYLSPRHAPARVRLGRAYLALRYPEKAVEQAEQAIADDPEAPDARKLLDEARQAAATGGGPGVAAPLPGASSAGSAPARPGPKAYKLTPAPEEPKPASTGPRTFTAPTASIAAAPAPAPAPAGNPDAAAQHYRIAIGLLQNRDWMGAINELSFAIRDDPKLAVAYSARGSALFGLGKYGEAAEDYQKAIALDANLGTPIYGFAECHRMLGNDKKAAEAYGRYAKSTAPDVRDDLRATAAKRAQELQ
jgi:tetratricopeptide (TPR) repeat protein